MNRTSFFSPSARRWLRRIALALLLLYGVYLTLGNLFLNTSLGEWTVNRKPEKFQMHWSSGQTWWPGRISIANVKIQGHASRADWQMEASRASGHIFLLALLRKQVHVPELRVDDVSGSVERKQARPASASASASSRPAGEGWMLRFDRIASDSVRQGRFDGLVLEGKGSAEVSFSQQLRGGPMTLLPSKAAFRNARLTHDGTEWLREAALDAEFAIAEHRSADAVGIDKLLKTDARLKLDGVTAALDIQVSPDGKVAVTSLPGKGAAHTDLAFSRGQLKPGSKLRWTAPVTGRDIAGGEHNDELDIALSVDRDITLKVKVPPQAEGKLSVDADLHIAGTQVPLRNFTTLIPRASGHIVARWRFGSLRWLGDFFPQAPWLSLDGAGDVDADVQVANGQLTAGSRIGVPDVDAVADVMGNRIRGRARADIRLEAGPNGELLPRLDAVMQRFDIAAVETPGKPYVQGRDLRLRLDAGPELDHLRQSLRGQVTFKNASVPDLRVYNRYLPQPQLRFLGGSGRLSGDMVLDAAGNVGHGTLRVMGQRAQMMMAGMRLRGDVDIDLKLRRADLKRRRFVVDGSTVQLKNIGFQEPSGEARSGWWARIVLDRAQLDIDRPLNAGGFASVTMKDVGFLLSLFSRQREYPAWIYRLIDAGSAQMRGRVQWRADALILDSMEARNQRFDLHARLRLQGARRNGQLYAKWRALSLGLELNDDRRRFHLIGAKAWYDAQPALLK
ncbi:MULTISPECIES: hypothetical protein [unclassified Pseudoxanthomonas]|uniref:hypothetical protein n=1 Tax=unclassified Pseudoxanthomonas TaxID=2645906 RepID=UPI003077C9D8